MVQLTSHEIRRFQLERDHDETGISGTGVVAYGVRFPDNTCVLRWDTQVNSTVFYSSIADLLAIHGHQGATRLVWLDITGPPTVSLWDAWTELRGYVEAAAEDGGPFVAAELLAYMDELKRVAIQPSRDWMKQFEEET